MPKREEAFKQEPAAAVICHCALSICALIFNSCLHNVPPLVQALARRGFRPCVVLLNLEKDKQHSLERLCYTEVTDQNGPCTTLRRAPRRLKHSENKILVTMRITMQRGRLFSGLRVVGPDDFPMDSRSPPIAPTATGGLAEGERIPLLHYFRSDRKPARSSCEKSCGCSQAAKCPPFSSVL